MAKVGFNDTTLLGTSAESRYLLTQYALDNTSKLTRNSATELQCEAQPGKRNFIVVNGAIVSLATAKTCTVSGAGVHNLIAADGTDASTTPSASTLYHVYLSNASASFAPDSCRISATAPSADSNGVLYLATSGNGHNWRFVGAVQLDGSTQIADDFTICGYGDSTLDLVLPADFVKSSGTTGNYDVFSTVLLVLPGIVEITSIARCNAASMFVSVSVDNTVKRQIITTAASDIASEIDYTFVETDIASKKIAMQVYWMSGWSTITFLGGMGYQNVMTIVRRPC